jgi:branched-chain amino acid transport system permease protein
MEEEGLKVKKLSKAINGLKIVTGVTVSFLPGRITSLIGPNGAGKTTLFHLVTGELKADNGSIIYRGENITALPPYKIARKGIGRLFQDVRIFENLTTLENVASSCYSHKVETPWFPFLNMRSKKEINKDVMEKASFWLDFVGLSDMKNSPASFLSYGQQKLLSVARLLAGGFTLFLLDEPTAGLSPVMIKKVLDLLEKIVSEDKNKTIVLVEHDMGVVRDIADWVYFMNEGRISFFGRTDHVLGDKEVREIYLGL